MSAEKQERSDTMELLDDIRYVNQINKDEIRRANVQIRERLADAGLDGNVTDILIKEIGNELGRLSARVKLVEKALRSKGPRQTIKPTKELTRGINSGNQPAIQFEAKQLAGGRNLLPVETSKNGVSYVWSSAEPELQFTFSLNRNKALGMQIYLYALIKPQYSKSLKILVDEEHIKHRVILDNGLFILSGNLPAAPMAGETVIKIILPATHSPVALGVSNDYRKLGIAINKISFGDSESGFTHLLKRVKSRL